ncbi:MAG: gamma-glutamyltransferase [Methyloprofundus sp.]|nr:gamma-glutamyltransferase [Methyloprofundus sp.]
MFWSLDKFNKGLKNSSWLLLVFISITGCSTHKVREAAIASAHPLATQAGFEVLNKGGNVYDAAVAVSAVLAVVEPSGSGLGGGGFWLLHRESDNLNIMLDGREKAPLSAHKAMYLDKQGQHNKQLSLNGALAAGIPGMPAALVYLSKNYGQLSLSESLAPAIRYAEQGFVIGERHRKLLRFREAVLKQQTEIAELFLIDGKIPKKGSLLRQKALAETLKQIVAKGKAGFYQGDVADKLVSSVQKLGGIWQLDDLKKYQVKLRQPIVGQYKDMQITSAALPSAGGTLLVEALNILETLDLDSFDEITQKHLIIESLRHAYHDRALYLGDDDFVEVPSKRLLNKQYAYGLASSIRADKSLASDVLSGYSKAQQGGRNTTHFSIIDKQGNRVAATLSINFPFGAGIVAEGTGVVLNNEMDDFQASENAANGYGLVGGKANLIVPEKRMLSSMSPSFVEQKGRVGVLGTPGGSRIPSMVLLAILDFAKGNNPSSQVSVKRFHHQYKPDIVLYEKGGLDKAEILALEKLGQRLKQHYNYGNMQAVQLDKSTGVLSAASDPRGEGFASVQKISQ